MMSNTKNVQMTSWISYKQDDAECRVLHFKDKFSLGVGNFLPYAGLRFLYFCSIKSFFHLRLLSQRGEYCTIPWSAPLSLWKARKCYSKEMCVVPIYKERKLNQRAELTLISCIQVEKVLPLSYVWQVELSSTPVWFTAMYWFKMGQFHNLK